MGRSLFVKVEPQKAMAQADDFLDQAWSRIITAAGQTLGVDAFHPASAIHNAIESTEFSIKAIAVILLGEYPRRHSFKEQQFGQFLSRIIESSPDPSSDFPSELDLEHPGHRSIPLMLIRELEPRLQEVTYRATPFSVPRALFLSNFWSGFYSISKYGFETLNIPAGELFSYQEAELALDNAMECYWVALCILSWKQWRSENT